MSGFTVRVVAADAVEDADAGHWAALEARALEPNAYLSPYFVRPAARHLMDSRVPLVLFVERTTPAARELVGVAVLSATAPGWRFPLRRLAGYETPYNYVGGLLLDRECAADALMQMLAHVRRAMPRFCALELPRIWADGPLVPLAQSLPASLGAGLRVMPTASRSILMPALAQQELSAKGLASRLRDIGRRERRLRERGAVEWRCFMQGGVPDSAVEAFLALEHMGWKGSGGSSLRSNPRDEAFFREMVAGFSSEGRALFTEVALDGVAVASTCNFFSGRVGFAFKVGWNPEFRHYSPGWLNEIELMRRSGQLLPDVEFMESGASGSSYIDELWLQRRPMATLAIPTGWAGRAAVRGLVAARALRRSAAELVARATTTVRRRRVASGAR